MKVSVEQSNTLLVPTARIRRDCKRRSNSTNEACLYSGITIWVAVAHKASNTPTIKNSPATKRMIPKDRTSRYAADTTP